MRAAAAILSLALFASSAIADEAPLNAHVLRTIGAYPTDGTHDYWWPKDGTYDGTTCDLEYAGAVVARGEAKKRTYCCGLTFEVWLRACEAAAKKAGKKELKIGELDAAALRKLKSDWYVATGKREGPVDALVPRGLGRRIERPADARPGDFVQLWRKNGSGHSVIFIAWEREAGKIVGIRYWSTQPATKGIGVRIERFDGEKGVKPEEIYIVRAFTP